MSSNKLFKIIKIGHESKPERDEVLVNRFRYSHENEIIAELFERYAIQIFGVCFKYLKDEEESKDASMEIFEKIIFALKKHQVKKFKPWLYQLTKNHCLSIIRKRQPKKNKIHPLSSIPEKLIDNISEYNGLQTEEKEKFYRNLKVGIKNLEVQQRECIELFYLQNQSYKEIAEKTGYELKQVKSYLQNGKRNLRAYLNKAKEKSGTRN